MTITNAIDDPDRPLLERLIGFDTLNRPLESWYAFVGRLIRANLLNDVEIRNQLPADWVRWAFAPHGVQTAILLLPAPILRDCLLRSSSFGPRHGNRFRTCRAHHPNACGAAPIVWKLVTTAMRFKAT